MERVGSVASHVVAGPAAAAAGGSSFTVVDDSFTDASGATVSVKQLRNTGTGEFAEILVDAPGKGGATGGLCLRSKVTGELRFVCPHRGGVAGTVMVPFANRVKFGSYTFGQQVHQLNDGASHASHGLLMKKPQLDVSASSADSNGASVTLSTSLDGTDPGYPFCLDISFRYTLDAEGLTIDVTATNTMKAAPAP